ncbi:VOC family protein [Pseudactinotalea sp. HY158]|uniref:VOC family protein n=1 Tax=Pseudactinotalea sp. HY158 TaxID=2654547 RepID=UPI00129C4173|nr:VOC family protein [Pseudactinotalea sp. HY158]QGH68954.1 pterin-4-alpha-carbinolamine dehydratase [Pseudactinotalea sp. HY158]
MAPHLSPSDVHGADLPDWRIFPATLATVVHTGTMITGVEFVSRIMQVAEEHNHHPDVALSYPRVVVTLTSHDVGAVTERDVAMARAITTIAEEMELAMDLADFKVLEIAIDAMDLDAVRPFWEAVLGYVPGSRPEDLVDPLGLRPLVWFQQMDVPRPERNSVHLDVHVPEDEAGARVAAALAAGGRLVDGGAAPSFWVLADAEGNEACVCTWRSEPDPGGA